MQTHEKIEIALIPLALPWVGSLVFSGVLPSRVSIGSVLAIFSLILLMQGFFRDLWLLYQQKKAPADPPKYIVKCMCIESSVGMAGMLCGLVLTLVGAPWSIPLSLWGWVAGVGATLVAGFVMKDYIIMWSPLGIRKEKNHANIVVKFRS